MHILWKIVFGFVAIYYLYVAWILLSKKNKNKLNEKNSDYLQINDKFVNNTLDEQTDLEAILSQADEVENNSKLLEAFKKGSESEPLHNSLTRKKNETFKIIRNKDAAEKKDSDFET